MQTSKYKKISDLLFIGEAIDLPYYDFVVGIQTAGSEEGKAYNGDEGKELTQHLSSLTEKTIIHLSHQPSPPKDETKEMLKAVGINHVVASMGFILADPQEDGVQLEILVNLPAEFFQNGVIEANPEELLDMLKSRIKD